MSLSPEEKRLLLQSVLMATEDLGFCRNRVWAIAKGLPGGAKEFPKLLPPQKTPLKREKRRNEDHEFCTYDFCEQSRVNFTLVKQRHENSCDEGRCLLVYFNPEFVANAVHGGQRTVWDLWGHKVLQNNERYMAISHVWSDGTGAGNQPPGHVNFCLMEFFREFARRFGCKGLWWDTICIPTKKDLREKALKNMHCNYQAAAVTLVHDSFLRTCEWRDADSACFDIVMSPWFSRGWTALELKMSQKVQVIFNSRYGPITKDLDKDILGERDSHSISLENKLAKGILSRIRTNEAVQLNDLVAILGSRHTSWPRDMAIISGLMIGIELPEDFAHQRIYQEILQKLGRISHAHLFHKSATMTNGYNWCPTNIYELPVILLDNTDGKVDTLEIEENGNLFGKWNIVSLDLIENERFISGDAHPLIEAKVSLAREEKNEHIILIEPGLTSRSTGVNRGLLVKPSVVDDKTCLNCYCDYIGPVYFHPALMTPEIEKHGPMLSFHVHVGYDETNHSRSDQSTTKKKNAQSMIEEMKSMNSGSNNTQYRKRQSDPNPFDLGAMNKSKLLKEFIKAASDGEDEKVESLLKQISDPNQADESGWTALHHAVWNNHQKVVDLLLKVKNLKLQQKNKRGEEPLHLAADRGNEKLMRKLLKGSTPNWKRDDDGLNALHLAAMNNVAAILDELLQNEWEINEADAQGQTALHMASDRGHEAVVRDLTNKNADHTLKDHNQETALSLAVFSGHEETAELLKGKGAVFHVWGEHQRTLLQRAALQNQDLAITILVNLGEDLEAQDHNGYTPLHLAVTTGYITTIKALIKLKANLEAQEKYGSTPLHLAVMQGDITAMKTLINLGAKAEAPDKKGLTPLHWAAIKGHDTAIRTLHELGAKAEAQDINGYTPLHWAATKGHDTAIKTLLELGAKAEAQDNNGYTPLHWAELRSRDAATKILGDYLKARLTRVTSTISAAAAVEYDDD